MELAEKKVILGDYSEKLKKEIKKEIAVAREIEDDKASLKQVQMQKENGDVLETDVYASYDEWIEQLEKEIKSGGNRLKTIAFKKIELEAIEAFIA